MPGLLIGYARCSTDAQDLTAQRDALAALGVEPERTYVDYGLTGTNRARPSLREALAACRAGDHSSDLHVSVAAALCAHALNVGYGPVLDDAPALARGRLSHVDQNYLRPECYAAANAVLIAA